jgi:mxaJ protein
MRMIQLPFAAGAGSGLEQGRGRDRKGLRFRRPRPTRSARTLLVSLLAVCASPAFAQHTQYPGAAPAPANEPLRVCADPNNLPFSNRAGEGFENKLAQTAARAMGKQVEYTWEPQRKQFLKDTLDADKCDVVMSLPTQDREELTTRPYYRSAYALVYRTNAPYRLKSLDDPRLRKLKIGVHSLGDDWVDLPGGATLAARGIIDNVHIYKMDADQSRANPAADLMDAVARGEVDVAIVWGPRAGYFATREPVKLAVVPLTDTHMILPFQFSISMAVRHGDEALRDRLNAILRDKRDAIHALLAQYGVPQLDVRNAPAAAMEAVTQR